MLIVSVRGAQNLAEATVELGNTLQSVFRFKVGGSGVPLYLDDSLCGIPFRVGRESGVLVSSWNCLGIAHYLEQAPEQHLLTMAMIGLVQWRGLMGNALLIPEDFLYSYSCGCLFEERYMHEDYPLLLERPHLCVDCDRFYSSICPDSHLSALKAVIGESVSFANEGCAA